MTKQNAKFPLLPLILPLPAGGGGHRWGRGILFKFLSYILLFAFCILIFSSFTFPVQARVCYTPLVQCGLDKGTIAELKNEGYGDCVPSPDEWGATCTLCHFFEMIDRIYKYVVFRIAPLLATLFFAYGGLMMIVSGEKTIMLPAGPQTRNVGKQIITWTAMGLAVIFLSWLIVHTVIGIFAEGADWAEEWWVINC